MNPIELIPASATMLNAPGERLRKEVRAIKTVNSPVVKI